MDSGIQFRSWSCRYISQKLFGCTITAGFQAAVLQLGNFISLDEECSVTFTEPSRPYLSGWATGEPSLMSESRHNDRYIEHTTLLTECGE